MAISLPFGVLFTTLQYLPNRHYNRLDEQKYVLEVYL